MQEQPVRHVTFDDVARVVDRDYPPELRDDVRTQLVHLGEAEPEARAAMI